MTIGFAVGLLLAAGQDGPAGLSARSRCLALASRGPGLLRRRPPRGAASLARWETRIPDFGDLVGLMRLYRQAIENIRSMFWPLKPPGDSGT